MVRYITNHMRKLAHLYYPIVWYKCKSLRIPTTTRFSPKGRPIGCQKQTAPRYSQHPIRWAFTSQAFTRRRHLSTS